MTKSFKKQVLSGITIFLLLLFLLAAGSRIVLQRGVRFERLSLGPVTLTGFVLRLDQGFVIEAKQLDINGPGPSDRDTKPKVFLPRLRKWSYLIREVDIGTIRYQDYAAGLKYRDGRFRITGRDVSLDAMITFDDSSFRMDLTGLQIRPLGISMTGKGSYHRADDLYLFDGDFDTPWGKGSLTIRELGDDCTIRVSTDRFTDLAAILRRFPMNEDIPAWIEANITAEAFQVNELRLDFKFSEISEITPADIRGTAVAERAAIRFHPDLAPVRCDRIMISYQDDKLSFKLSKPRFLDRKLDGSSVKIAPLTGDEPHLYIHVLTESMLDRNILDILAAYDIALPMRQAEGTTRADLRLDFRMPEFSVRYRGRFHADKGTWLWGNTDLQIEEADVSLKDHLVTLHQIKMAYRDLFSGRLSGTVDSETGKARLQCDIERLRYSMGKTPLIDLADMTVPLRITFGPDETVVHADGLNTSISFTDKTRTIAISSLEPYPALIPLLKTLSISQGSLTARIAHDKSFDLDADIQIPNPYLSLDSRPVTWFKLKGTGTHDQAEISINDDRITINLSTEKVVAAIRDYLVTIETDKFDDSSNFHTPIPLKVTGPKALLKITSFEVPTGPFTFQEEDRDFQLNAQVLNGTVEFIYKPEGFTLVGRDLDAELFDIFFENMDLSAGTFDIVLRGNQDNSEGFLEVRNILIKNTKMVNNVLAFINTIPALMTFSAPGFDSNGYVVRDGVGTFNYSNRKITVHHLHLDGETVDVEARGWIDRKQRTIDMNIELFTLKDYSKIINKIPLAGYAILGEDGSLSTALTVTGDLDNPEISTNLTYDILSTPINVIKRTVQWPFYLFREKKPKELDQVPNELPEPADTGSGSP